MELKDRVGKIVLNNYYGQGKIIEVDNYLIVDFDGKIVKFKLDAFSKGFLRFVDNDFQLEVDNEIREAEIEKARIAEERRIAVEKVEEERKQKAAELAKQKAAEEAAKKHEADERAKNKNKSKKSGPIHPYIDERRRSEKPVIFMVCQNDTYDVELKNGYIWAPDHKMRGDTDLASHAELDQVKKGDIIFHHFRNKIYAISVAKNDCERKAPTIDHPDYNEIGRYVDLSYHFLLNPADTTDLKLEKVTYGSMKYGPFEKTGKNKEGFYLSELADKIAMAFIEAAITANTSDKVLIDIKNKI